MVTGRVAGGPGRLQGPARVHWAAGIDTLVRTAVQVRREIPFKNTVMMSAPPRVGRPGNSCLAGALPCSRASILSFLLRQGAHPGNVCLPKLGGDLRLHASDRLV